MTNNILIQMAKNLISLNTAKMIQSARIYFIY